MEATLPVEIGPLSRSLKLRPAQVEAVVRLLDDGNTVPFITRYRRDQTGGLDEERIREGGCEAYLSKPISVGKFIETIRSFLGNA